MVAKVRKTREYENNTHNNKNRPSQPFGRWLLVWARATHERWIECVCGEPEHNGHESHEYPKNPSCQELLPPRESGPATRRCECDGFL